MGAYYKHSVAIHSGVMGLMIGEQRTLNLTEAAHYRIRAQGEFNPDWLDFLSGEWVIADRQATHQDVTILIGQVVDQAALLGVLEQLYSLGFPLLSIECLPSQARPGTRRLK